VHESVVGPALRYQPDLAGHETVRFRIFACGTEKGFFGYKNLTISGGRIVADLPLVLVVEDEFFLQADLEHALAAAGFATDVAFSGEEALGLLMKKRHDALVTDVKLAGALDGWDVAKRIREKDPSFPVVYVTAYDQDWEANGVPNSVVIPKPFTSAKVVAAVSSLLPTT
jgi:CheY-like chemotaxis protein